MPMSARWPSTPRANGFAAFSRPLWRAVARRSAVFSAAATAAAARAMRSSARTPSASSVAAASARGRR